MVRSKPQWPASLKSPYLWVWEEFEIAARGTVRRLFPVGEIQGSEHFWSLGVTGFRRTRIKLKHRIIIIKTA